MIQKLSIVLFTSCFLLFGHYSVAGDIVNSRTQIKLSKSNMGAKNAWKGYVNPVNANGDPEFDDRVTVNFMAGTGGIGDPSTGSRYRYLKLPYSPQVFKPDATVQTNTVGINFNGSGYSRIFVPHNPNDLEQMGESYVVLKENKGFGIYMSGGNRNDKFYLPHSYIPYLFQRTWDDETGNNTQAASVALGFKDNPVFEPFMGANSAMRFQFTGVRFQTADLGGDNGHCRYNIGFEMACVISGCTNKRTIIQLRAASLPADLASEGKVAKATNNDNQMPYNFHTKYGSSTIRDKNSGEIVATHNGSSSVTSLNEVPTSTRNFDININFANFKSMLKAIAKRGVEESKDASSSIKNASAEEKARHWFGPSWSSKSAWKVEAIRTRMELTQHSKRLLTRCGASWEGFQLDQL